MKDPHVGGQQLPLLVPDSPWVPPTELPDLRGRVKEIAEDLETKDEGLAAGRGPGWAHRAGYICGVAWAWDGGSENAGSIYVPLRHPDTTCFDPDQVKRWIKDHREAGIRFIYQNNSYDQGWIGTEFGLKPPALIDDTTAMAVMIDENRRSFDLDSLCRWQGLPGKDERLLEEAVSAYGYSDVKKNLWRIPARFVGPYAEQDAVGTLALSRKLRPLMEAEETDRAYGVEMDILPLTVEMRRRGIRIDVDGAEKLERDLLARRDRVLRDLSDKLQHTVGLDDVRSARTLERWFTYLKIPFNRTAKTGQAQFESDWMRRHEHWLPRMVSEARQLTEAAEKFVRGFILEFAHRGRVHATINQFRTDDGGTRSHRFSYADPPLQQMPSRPEKGWPLTGEIALAIRGLFLPEEGETWCKPDYSQQEYRHIVHTAELLELPRAEEAGDRYRSDPNTDFHQMVADMTGLDRSPAKDVNFAKAFGAGVDKFAIMTGLSRQRAAEIMGQYDEKMPFVKELGRKCMELAESRGYIKLIDGARIHFNLFEAARKELNYGPDGKWLGARELEFAKIQWPDQPLKRYRTFKAMNSRIQGSAARHTKLAMRACWREGLVPLLQMHDELDFSLSDEKTGLRIGEIMRDVVKLRVPMQVDIKFGPNWGLAKSTWAELHPPALVRATKKARKVRAS